MASNVKNKAKQRRANAEKRPHAHARYIRISPRKVKIVIDLIRGKSIRQAAAILQYTPKAATEPVLKLLNSAIANAEANLDLDRETLYIAEIYVGQGPTLKRYRPRARGSAAPIRKRTSHISIVLDQVQ